MNYFWPGSVNTHWGPGPVNTNLVPGPVNTSWGAKAGKYKLGARTRVGGQAKGRGPGNTNTPKLLLTRCFYSVHSNTQH